MKELTITCARCRMVRGETQYNNVSRFVREIPSELLARKSVMPREPKKPEVPQNTSYQKAKEAFRNKDV